MTEMTTARPLAVVTGAGSGIGYEPARQFAQHGIERAGADPHRDGGAAVQACRVDLATFEGVEELSTVTALMPDPTDTNVFERADMLGTKVGPDTVRAETHRRMAGPGSAS
jgi:NAD(P)-dependent dehydrogenase (short-subunit alcohol dehydrogenase family)